MRYLAILLLMLQADSVIPTVSTERHEETTVVQGYDTTVRKCPDGYEGHFIDPHIGIGQLDESKGADGFIWYGSGEPAYAVCLKKSFMDEVRKKPELKVMRYYPRPL